jgi:toxin ParE1/3/4
VVPRAKADIQQIWDYIARDSELRADEQLERIDQLVELLSQQPYMGRLRPFLGHGVTSFRAGSYLIFYCVLRSELQILRGGSRAPGAAAPD